MNPKKMKTGQLRQFIEDRFKKNGKEPTPERILKTAVVMEQRFEIHDHQLEDLERNLKNNFFRV